MPRAKDDNLVIEHKDIGKVKQLLEEIAATPPPGLEGHYDFAQECWPLIEEARKQGHSVEYIAESLTAKAKKLGLSIQVEAQKLDHAIRSVRRIKRAEAKKAGA